MFNRVKRFLLCAQFLVFPLLAQEPAGIHGAYFGQRPPGPVPEVFAPGFVSTEQWEAAGTFSPDGKEYFFTRRPICEGRENRIFYTRCVDGKWSVPVLASFGQDIFEMEPHITPEGKILFFNSERSRHSISRIGEIWYVEMGRDGWGEAHYLDSPVNDGFTMYVSATWDGTIYYTGVYDRRHGIYRSKQSNGTYGSPEYLPQEINDIRGASHPFIAPDESFLIFDAQVSGPLKPELHISFRKDDGSWTPAINMGPDINATRTEFGASLSPDGKYLFFHRTVKGNGDIYWMNSEVIQKMKSEMLDDKEND